jgi:hypothetical protein
MLDYPVVLGFSAFVMKREPGIILSGPQRLFSWVKRVPEPEKGVATPYREDDLTV